MALATDHASDQLGLWRQPLEVSPKPMQLQAE